MGVRKNHPKSSWVDMEASKRARVLIVDGDSAIRDTFRAVLESNGYECSVATTAGSAWALCKSGKFDCMLLHASLDGASGLALAQRLSAEPETRPRSIVLMSGHPKSEFVTELRVGLADSFLQKPADEQELLAAVARCIAD